MLDKILEISKTHSEDSCNNINESSYIQKNIEKTEEHIDLTDLIIASNDPSYSLLPNNEKVFYLKQRRIEIGSEIEENKLLIENYNFNNYLTVKKIQSGLMKKNSISSLLFLSEYYKCKISLIDPKNNMYCDTPRNFGNSLVISRGDDSWGLGSLKNDYTKCFLKNINGLIKDIVSYDIYDIPLKHIGSYKSCELHEMANENGIDIKANGKTKIKKVLYEDLRTHFLNLI